MATTFVEDKIRLTYDDYARLPNDGKRYEIVEGDLLMSPAPKPKHEFVQSRVFVILYAFVEKHNLGRVFVAPQSVVLEKHTVVQPDIFFVARSRLHLVTELNIQGAPDLVIEIESDYDERAEWIRKFKACDRYGVKELWHVRPNSRVMDVHRRMDARLDHVERALGNGKLTTPLLPRLAVPLTKIWS